MGRARIVRDMSTSTAVRDRADELLEYLTVLSPGPAPDSCMVLGERFKEKRAVTGNSAADVILLAPAPDELASSSWIERAVAEVSARLNSDGMVYVMAPALARRRLRAQLRARGIVRWDAFVHYPDVRAGRHLIPLEPGQVAFAARHLAMRRGRRRLAATAARIPGLLKLLASLSPHVGLGGRRANAAPLMRWLAPSLPAGSVPALPIISGSWRGSRGATIAHCFVSGGRKPLLVAKIAATDSVQRRLTTEADALRILGEDARAAGARVPRVAAAAPRISRPGVQLQTALAGVPATAALASGPTVLEPLLRQLAEWLHAWHGRTVRKAPDPAALLRSTVLDPAGRLVPLIDGGAAYMDFLRVRCGDASRGTLYTVAAHQDLTMSNILWSRQEGLGIVDWESATPTALPLTDFLYSALDAVMTAHGMGNRVDGWKACFEGGSEAAPLVAELSSTVLEAVPESPALPQLAFHATWLHHASNERDVTIPSAPRPFLEIVRRIAADPDRWETLP
jgi:hypothetical protein